jgi:hypothetical protein
MKSQTLREEIKFLESVLPIYDKRTYMACDRISLALSYAAYLEGLIAASTPGIILFTLLNTNDNIESPHRDSFLIECTMTHLPPSFFSKLI